VSDAKCLVQAGKAAGADVVFVGSVERFSDGYVFRLRAVPTAGGEPQEIKKLVQGGAPDLIGSGELVSCQLLKLDRCEGTLRVSGPSGAHLLVDGKDVGALPFSGSLAIGRHALKASGNGRTSEETWIGVSWKQETAFNVGDREGKLVFEKGDFAALPEILPPLPEPPPPPPVVAAPAPIAPPPPPPLVAEVAPVPAAPPVVVAPPPAVIAPPAAPVPTPAPVVVAPKTEDLPLPTAITTAPPAPAPEPVVVAPPVEARKPAPTPMKPNLTPSQRVAFFAAAGATGAMLVGGIIAGSVSLGTANSLNAKYAAGTLTPSDKSSYDSARGAATAANVFFGLAALGAVTTGVIYLVDPRVATSGAGGDVAEPTSIGIGPANVTVRGSF
jgi:hypothetical protein